MRDIRKPVPGRPLQQNYISNHRLTVIFGQPFNLCWSVAIEDVASALTFPGGHDNLKKSFMYPSQIESVSC